MATTVARLQAILDADTRGFDSKMRTSQSKTEKAGHIMKGALIGGVAAGITAVGVAAKIGWDEYNEGAKVAAQTNAVIKSTGGVANVTAQHVDDLATSLMNLSGTDDELIKSSENVLLTFRNIQNEGGKGNDIFDQTTKAVLDLSTAMHQDLQSSAVQVGKALNNPTTGLSRLMRVGVEFSDKQVKLITHLQKTGHTMEAQKEILKELNTEFGGSAKAAGETLPGKLDILQERFRNFTGQLVEKAIPAISDFVGFIGKVGKGKTLSVKVTTSLAGAGSALEKLLFGSPGERVRVPVDQKHFEWVVTGGGDGLVGAIGNAIRDINWTAVGNAIAKGMGEAGQKAGDSLLDQFGETVQDKIQSPHDIWGAAWTATKVEAEFFPATHVWRKVWSLIEEDAEAGVAAVGVSLGHMAGDAQNAAQHVSLLDTAVEGLKSTTIHINAVVSGLSYVAALQEHLAIINAANKNVNLNVGHNAAGTSNWRGGLTWVGERGPEIVNLPRGSQIIPANQTAGTAATVYNFNGAILDGDRLLSYIREQERRNERRGR